MISDLMQISSTQINGSNAQVLDAGHDSAEALVTAATHAGNFCSHLNLEPHNDWLPDGNQAQGLIRTVCQGFDGRYGPLFKPFPASWVTDGIHSERLNKVDFGPDAPDPVSLQGKAHNKSTSVNLSNGSAT